MAEYGPEDPPLTVMHFVRAAFNLPLLPLVIAGVMLVLLWDCLRSFIMLLGRDWCWAPLLANEKEKA